MSSMRAALFQGGVPASAVYTLARQLGRDARGAHEGHGGVGGGMPGGEAGYPQPEGAVTAGDSLMRTAMCR